MAVVSLQTVDTDIALDHTSLDAELSFDPRSKDPIPVDFEDAIGYVYQSRDVTNLVLPPPKRS